MKAPLSSCGASPNIKERRLLVELNLKDSGRVRDDLSREFFRTLSELRRQQQWRRQLEMIDVSPEDEGGARPEKG
jgi:hypothetical protein